MALIKCPECGKEISDKAISCPNCGYPISSSSVVEEKREEQDEEIQTTQEEDFASYQAPPDFNSDEPQKAKQKPYAVHVVWNATKWVLALLVFILSCASFDTSFLGFVILLICAAMICPLSKRITKKFSTTARIMTPIVLFIVGMVAYGNSLTAGDADVAIDERVEIESVDDLEIESDTFSEEETSEAATLSEDDCTELFYYDLIVDYDSYLGEAVKVIIPVYDTDDEDSKITTSYTSYSELGTSNHLTLYPDNYDEYSGEGYIEVIGIATADGSLYELKDSHIVSCENDLDETYNELYAEWSEQQQMKAEEEEGAFREEAVSCTYEDLYRYPDTYKDAKIKVNVKITSVEPDGLIFDGDIFATLDGNEVAIFDKREVQEPTLKAGDAITIYGYGNGLVTINVQDTSGLIPKTVDKYEIPGIKIIYMDLN